MNWAGRSIEIDMKILAGSRCGFRVVLIGIYMAFHGIPQDSTASHCGTGGAGGREVVSDV